MYWLRDQRRGNTNFISQKFARSVHDHPTAKRLALLGSVIGSFALGAGLGAAAHESFPRWSMFPPVFFLLWLIYQDYSTPICEISTSRSVAETTGLEMPLQIAVYLLKQDTTRRGVVQRLPDLHRWWSALSPESAIVILDFSDTRQLHPNAALELRSLMKQAESHGRKLLLSGISPEERHSLQRSGAGDAILPANVCENLETAVARAMALAVVQAGED
jgi:anti-anti-sigma regulatory factor